MKVCSVRQSVTSNMTSFTRDFYDSFQLETHGTLKQWCLRKHRELQCAKSFIVELVPLFQWVHEYNLQWFKRDIIAGITVAILLVPQSLAYAQLAGLPPEWGLYGLLTIYSIHLLSKYPMFYLVIDREIYSINPTACNLRAVLHVHSRYGHLCWNMTSCSHSRKHNKKDNIQIHESMRSESTENDRTSRINYIISITTFVHNPDILTSNLFFFSTNS